MSSLIYMRTGALICFMLVWVSSYCAVNAQGDTAPMTDTFSSGDSASGESFTGGGGMPSLIPMPLNFMVPNLMQPQPDPDVEWGKVIEDIDKYREALPNDPHALISKLRGLIQQRLDQWGEVRDCYDDERWRGYGDAILRKLPNDRCEYAWNDVYWLAASDYWNGDPEKKQDILKGIVEADKICNGSDRSPSSKVPKRALAQDNHKMNNPSAMPPLAPVRVNRLSAAPRSAEVSSTNSMPPIAPPREQLNNQSGRQSNSLPMGEPSRLPYNQPGNLLNGIVHESEREKLGRQPSTPTVLPPKLSDAGPGGFQSRNFWSQVAEPTQKVGIEAANWAASLTKMTGFEWGGVIYKDQFGNHYFTPPISNNITGTFDQSQDSHAIPDWSEQVADYHSHPGMRSLRPYYRYDSLNVVKVDERWILLRGYFDANISENLFGYRFSDDDLTSTWHSQLPGYMSDVYGNTHQAIPYPLSENFDTPDRVYVPVVIRN